MQMVDETLFLEFVDSLNFELLHAGATLRVERRHRPDDDITLVDSCGRALGQLPDHVDAATILAVEKILNGKREQASLPTGNSPPPDA